MSKKTKNSENEFEKFRAEILDLMLKDEIPKGKDDQYPYGYIEHLGIKTGYTFEQAKAMFENEAVLTADLMYREGMEINHRLRDKFPNSFFYQICYDDAICGVNPITQSIIYDCMRFGQLKIMFCEWSYPDYGDVMSGATDIIRWVKEITPGKLQGKVPPTLILIDDNFFMKYWDDLQYPLW
ncbi:MAG TPA: hypothetical protein PLL94_06560 [Bacteroidales bacterium]|jgi:hypothetical protein|nr:MAG: hypothetical protein BWX96_01442 [Bacteroidetes bacterium ADurb.Bin145]HOU02819.1 hypothetical protein [Bacteroidales bacterium]HQK67792.1 hypothetical protein [Bacteroidales bacterium]